MAPQAECNVQRLLHPAVQLIPGMTKSGKQKTPDWLNKFLGVKEEDIPKDVPRPAGFPDINGKPTQ